MNRAVIIALAITGSVATASAQAKTAPQILADVQKTYAGVTDMKATILQEVTNVTFGRTATTSGQVWLRRAGKMRWDYAAKPRKGQPPKTARSFVFDGTMMWMVDVENQQIVKKTVGGQMLPVAVAFLSGKPTWAADFRAKLDASGTYGVAGQQVLLLTPKRASASYKKLFLVVETASMQVRESIIIDAAGNTNRFRFESIDLAAQNQDTLFTVDPTSSLLSRYRLIDMTQPAP